MVTNLLSRYARVNGVSLTKYSCCKEQILYLLENFLLVVKDAVSKDQGYTAQLDLVTQ